MAEFGELLPGTEWLTANGKRAVVNVRIVSAGMFEPDGREMSNASWSFTERDVALWVRWVEPIAVGDRVERSERMTGSPVRLGTVRAVFEDEGGMYATIRWDGWLLETWAIDRCRKVNDE